MRRSSWERTQHNGERELVNTLRSAVGVNSRRESVMYDLVEYVAGGRARQSSSFVALSSREMMEGSGSVTTSACGRIQRCYGSSSCERLNR